MCLPALDGFVQNRRPTKCFRGAAESDGLQFQSVDAVDHGQNKGRVLFGQCDGAAELRLFGQEQRELDKGVERMSAAETAR